MAFSERSMGCTSAGMLSSIFRVLACVSLSGLDVGMLRSLRSLFPANPFISPTIEPCNCVHLESVCVALLMRSIDSACTGRPTHAGLTFSTECLQPGHELFPCSSLKRVQAMLWRDREIQGKIAVERLITEQVVDERLDKSMIKSIVKATTIYRLRCGASQTTHDEMWPFIYLALFGPSPSLFSSPLLHLTKTMTMITGSVTSLYKKLRLALMATLHGPLLIPCLSNCSPHPERNCQGFPVQASRHF